MKKYKPTTKSRRAMSVVSYGDFLTRSEPLKSLTRGFKRAVGRNNKGRITTRHKGGGNKKVYRDIDFVFNKRDIKAKLESVEYDPFRSAFIGVALYSDGERRYITVPQKMKVGDEFLVGENVQIKLGNRTVLHSIPVGTFVYNIELKPGAGARIARSAGTYAEVVAQDLDAKVTHLRMPSSEIRKVINLGWASIGEVSNEEHRLRNLGKAGRARNLGRRPTVRGSAMNAVDHPHGGGEGRQGIGLRRGPKTQQGKLAYGVKTRRPKKYSNQHIVERRKKKKKN